MEQNTTEQIADFIDTLEQQQEVILALLMSNKYHLGMVIFNIYVFLAGWKSVPAANNNIASLVV